MEEYYSIYDFTPLINVETLEYPVYYPAVRKLYPNTSFPYPIRDYILAPYGYAPVFLGDIPPGDVPVEGEPELRADGKWYRTWTTRPFTDEEIAQILYTAKEDLKANAKFVFDADIEGSAKYPFNGEDKWVSLKPKDLVSLLTSMHIVEDLAEDELVSYRFADGELVKITPSEFINLAKGICKINHRVNTNYWDYLTLVDEAPTVADLPPSPGTFV